MQGVALSGYRECYATCLQIKRVLEDIDSREYAS
jgi:hypothetical protein